MTLNKLGFTWEGPTEKDRISYKLGEIRFDFDTYPQIPTFLEIEAEDKDELLFNAEERYMNR